jgi:cob(I)alamin adenosyltransferase
LHDSFPANSTIRGYCLFTRLFKGIKTTEQDLSSWCDRYAIEQYGTGNCISGLAGYEEIRLVKQGICNCREVFKPGYFDLVVMVEVLFCIFYRIITPEEMISILNSWMSDVEVVLTGRRTPSELIAISDLATNMKNGTLF